MNKPLLYNGVVGIFQNRINLADNGQAIVYVTSAENLREYAETRDAHILAIFGKPIVK